MCFHIAPVLQAAVITISLFWFQCQADPISPSSPLSCSPSASKAQSFSSCSICFSQFSLTLLLFLFSASLSLWCFYFPIYASPSLFFRGLYWRLLTCKLCPTNAKPYPCQKRPPVEKKSLDISPFIAQGVFLLQGYLWELLNKESHVCIWITETEQSMII